MSSVYLLLDYAHSFGPYLPEVHAAYVSDSLHDILPSSFLEEYRPVFDSVFELLSTKKTRSLCNLVHGEDSWKHAMMKGEDIQDIKKDATRFRIRRFLLSNLEQFHKPIYV